MTATQARLDAHAAKEAAEHDLRAAEVLLNAEALWIADAIAVNRKVTEPELDKFRDRRVAHAAALKAREVAMNDHIAALLLTDGAA